MDAATGAVSATLSSFVIAIDGPSGTGKSTVARTLATRLGAGYLDTGAMYRIVAVAMLRADVDPDDRVAVADHLPFVQLDTPTDPQQQRHLLTTVLPDGSSGTVDVTSEIRERAATTAVTPVSANPAVRHWLLDRQQQLAHSGRMVVEGRDIGTVIAPDAQLKIYLTADAAERARRRHAEQTSGAATDSAVPGSTQPDGLAAVQADLDRRDRVDSSRDTSPLRAAADAVHVDTSTMTIQEVVEHLLELAAARGIRADATGRTIGTGDLTGGPEQVR